MGLAATDLRSIALVPDSSGLTRFKDLDLHWLLAKSSCSLVDPTSIIEDDEAPIEEKDPQEATSVTAAPLPCLWG